MMIIPQLITSVTTLYYTTAQPISQSSCGPNHLEFIEKNQQIMELLNSAYATISTNIDDGSRPGCCPPCRTSSAAQPWGC